MYVIKLMNVRGHNDRKLTVAFSHMQVVSRYFLASNEYQNLICNREQYGEELGETSLHVLPMAPLAVTNVELLM